MKYLLTIFLFMSVNLFSSYQLFYKYDDGWKYIKLFADWGRCQNYLEQDTTFNGKAVCKVWK